MSTVATIGRDANIVLAIILQGNTALLLFDKIRGGEFGTVSKPGHPLEIPCTIPRERNGISIPHEKQTEPFIP